MISCSKILLLAVSLVSIVQHSVAPPVTQKPEVENDILDNIGLEYKRYLQEVVSTLESDKDFREKLEKAEDVDVRTGKIAQELQYVRHDVRSKLDELKRAELERLRHYLRRQAELKQGLDADHIKKANDQTGHIDGSNPHTFEIADLEKLIAKTTQHLAEADRKRREEFKQYEMQKEFERNQERKFLDESDLDRYERKLRDQQQNLRHRKKQLHHPGSKAQLEEVWQYQDNMNVRDFDPKTFFFLHDVDGNGYLDHEEVKALFLRELQKLYSLGYPGEDLRERMEEMERMREHVFKEADSNNDGAISLQEWLDLTRRPEFNRDTGWDVLDPKKEYTPEEYHQFELHRQQEIEALIAQGKLGRKSQEQIAREEQYARQAEERRKHPELAEEEYNRQNYVHPPGETVNDGFHLPPLPDYPMYPGGKPNLPPIPTVEELERRIQLKKQQQIAQQQVPEKKPYPEYREKFEHAVPAHPDQQRQNMIHSNQVAHEDNKQGELKRQESVHQQQPGTHPNQRAQPVEQHQQETRPQQQHQQDPAQPNAIPHNQPLDNNIRH